jgi:hypothetical protein
VWAHAPTSSERQRQIMVLSARLVPLLIVAKANILLLMLGLCGVVLYEFLRPTL